MPASPFNQLFISLMKENTRLLTSQNCAPKVVKIYNYSIFIAVPVFNTNKSGLEFKSHSYPGLLRIKTKSAPFSIASLYTTQ